MIRGTPGREIVVYPRRSKLFALLLGSLGFVAAGAWIWIRRDVVRAPDWTVMAAVFLGIPFFASCAVYYLLRLIANTPSLLINETGLMDRASAASAGLLTWDEIDYVMPYRIKGQVMLGVMPVEVDEIIDRQGWFRRRLLRANVALGAPPVNIPERTLPISVVDLTLLLEQVYGVRVVVLE